MGGTDGMRERARLSPRGACKRTEANCGDGELLLHFVTLRDGRVICEAGAAQETSDQDTHASEPPIPNYASDACYAQQLEEASGRTGAHAARTHRSTSRGLLAAGQTRSRGIWRPCTWP
eukprot:3293334-Pleurochrysis_carterae.AAC.1